MKFGLLRTCALLIFCLTLSSMASAGTLLGTMSSLYLSEEAQKTLGLILDDGPFKDPRDGREFKNRGELPPQSKGYYHEYLVKSEDGSVLWNQRIVVGGSGADTEYFYTDNNFENYHRIQGNSMRIETAETLAINLPFNMHAGLLENVPSNQVQSIRAFRVADLQSEAQRLGQHFLYAYCAEAITKTQVLATLAKAFYYRRHFGKQFNALGDCLTNLTYRAGPQPGFIVVVEQLPNTPKFDREAREILLDVFRDASDYWAEKKTAFRVFYSFQ